MTRTTTAEDPLATDDTLDALDTGVVRPRSVLYSGLIGVAALVVLLQGLWAGMFLEHDGARTAATGWIDIHARGADLAIVLGIAATIVAFVKVRERRDLWAGSAAFVVLLILESYLGGLIRDQSREVLTVVHVPLAMAIMGLAVWLPLRARAGRSTR